MTPVIEPRPLLSIRDLSTESVKRIAETAFQFSELPEQFENLLAGIRVALVFTAPSTRTRASFWNVARTLGCDVLTIGPMELQLATGETWADTGAVLREYFDAVVIRTNEDQQHLRDLASSMPAVINALTYEEHPTQSFADYCALRAHFGSIDGLRVAYVGPINNTLRSLAQLVSKMPFGGLDIYSPTEGGLSASEVEELNSSSSGSTIRQYYGAPAEPVPVDAVYTCRWNSMGKQDRSEQQLLELSDYRVSTSMLRKFAGERPPVFMHDLPAQRGAEVESEILDGVAATSLVPAQTRHKGSAAAGALMWVLGQGWERATTTALPV